MVSPLACTHGLVDGLRVHLRLARRGDLDAAGPEPDTQVVDARVRMRARRAA